MIPIIGGGLVGVILIVLIVAGVSNGKRGSSSTLILQEFSLNENENEFLNIKGRASGFWNWILSLFDKAPTTIFTCNKQVLKYEASKIKYNIPLVNITCVSSGMLKSINVGLLILGILFFISGIATPIILGGGFSMGIVPILIGIVFLIVCILNKKKAIHFGIYIGENKPIVAITMIKGIIGSIDINKFESAANALNKVVLENTKAK